MNRDSTLASVAALALGAATPASGGEYTTFHPLWVTPAAVPGAAPGCRSVSLLNLPAGWQPGDVAVVLMTTAPVVDPLRDPLVAALLHENTAVLEIVAAPDRHCATEDDVDAAVSSPFDPVAHLLGALRVVTRDGGAGMAIAVGYGPGTAMALDAVRDDVAGRYLGAHTVRYAASAVLGDGPARFALREPRAGQGVPVRVGVLCEAIRQAGHGPDAQAQMAACRAALGTPPTRLTRQ